MANYSKSLGGLLAASAIGAGLVLGVGTATAAPQKAGHLVLTVDGAAPVTLAPGQAKKRALVACGEAAPAELDVDAVRAAFPVAFAVCEGVTLTSQIPAEVEEDVVAP